MAHVPLPVPMSKICWQQTENNFKHVESSSLLPLECCRWERDAEDSLGRSPTPEIPCGFKSSTQYYSDIMGMQTRKLAFTQSQTPRIAAHQKDSCATWLESRKAHVDILRPTSSHHPSVPGICFLHFSWATHAFFFLSRLPHLLPFSSRPLAIDEEIDVVSLMIKMAW